MADRILAAMDFMDLHNKPVMLKPKQRALGDIDGKYGIVDPLLDISYYPTLKGDVALTGVKKINPANDRSADEIVEQDREKMVQSAERARSAPSPYKENSFPSARPMTSSSWATVSVEAREEDRRLHNAMFTLSSASHASIKRLSFTSPAVNIGPSDVIDDVMNEIVNKPLVFRRNDYKSQSAPPGGRISSRYLKSSGKRSARWIASSKRARTSLHRRRRGNKSWEKNPGPFMTVKVSGKDLWIVSNSTPTSYFNDVNDDGLRETSGQAGTKLLKWEDAAEAVPKEEQASPPRHERLLGAPAQFAPTMQWLRYDPGAPVKKPPVLTPFKNSLTEGRYYNVDSTLSNKVTQHVNASPGIRIARNGAVVSHSLKLESSDDSNPGSVETSDGEESDVDVASMLPAKLAYEMKKHHSSKLEETAEASTDDEGSDKNEADETEELKALKEEERSCGVLDGVCSVGLEEEGDHESEKEDDEESDIASSLSSASEEGREEEKEDEKDEGDTKITRPMLTKDSLALLTKLTGQDLSNPLLAASNGSVTSREESMDSHELNEYLATHDNDVKHVKDDRVTAAQDDVWAVLEGGTPGLWTTKSKLEKLVLLKRLRRRLKAAEQPSQDRDSPDKPVKQEEVNEVILPLCWEDELNKADAKIFKVKNGHHNAQKQNGNTSLPVVFHKVLRYDRLPAATMASSVKVASAPHRPRSATARTVEGITFGQRPSKGYRAPVSTPRSNRSVRSRSASTTSAQSTSSGRGGSAPNSLMKGSEIVRQSLDLADLLRVTPDSFPVKTPHVTTHTVKKERVTIVHNDISEQEMEVVRRVAAQSMKGRTVGGDSTKISTVTKDGTKPDVALIEQSLQKANAPVGTINLSVLEVDNATNDTNTISSQRRSDDKFGNFATPQNTPKSASGHRIPSTPKNSARGSHTVPLRFLTSKEEYISTGVDVSQEGAVRKELAPNGELSDTANLMQISSPHGVKTSHSARIKSGFSSTPLAQNRLKSGSSRAASSYLGPASSWVNDKEKSAKSPSLATIIGLNTVGDAMTTSPAVQIGAAVSIPPPKSADFIQITQSLHISDRSGKEGHGMTGNKMYDSYMRELTVHGSDFDSHGLTGTDDGKGVVLGRGLGGTSGKSSGFSFPHSGKRNIVGYRGSKHHPQNQSVPNISPFTPQAGRRSGLTMVPQEKPGQNGFQVSQKPGPFGLGVKGDQVRLNIDKNIHNIYRDLGLIKAVNMGQKGEQFPPSPGRSHLSSAKSKSPRKDESVISIPTASEASGVGVVAFSSRTKTEAEVNAGITPRSVLFGATKRPSSSNPSVVVQDSDTQWSDRTAKQASSNTEPSVNGVSATLPVEGTQKSPLEPEVEENRQHARQSATPDSGLATEVEKVSETDQTSTPPGTNRSAETAIPKSSQTPTSDRSATRAVSRSSDAVSAAESNATGHSHQAPIHRSASETLLDRLAELGDQASEITDEEEEADNEEVGVKGVTRVTVNIPEAREG